MKLFRFWSWILATILAAVCCAGALAGTEALRWKPEAELRAFAAESLGLDAATLRIEPASDTTLAVSTGGEPVAYVGSTWEIAHTAGYSGRPVNVLVLVDTKAVVRGAWLIEQQEPVLTIGIEPKEIEAFVKSFTGYNLAEPLQSTRATPDAIAGATVSSGVIRSGIIRTARTMAAEHGLLGGSAARRIAPGPAKKLSWDELLASGAVAHLHVTGEDADSALGTSSGASADASFIDLYTAVLDPPAVGASLLGEAAFSDLLGAIGATDHAIFMAANGLYSFKGTDWRKSGRFERVEIHQGERTIALSKNMHRTLERSAFTGAPELREMAIFVLPAATGFDPAQPFRISLIASRADSSGQEKMARFPLTYSLPSEFLTAAATPVTAAPETPLWQENWLKRIPAISVVVAMLLALYLILIFQNQIASRPRLYRSIRAGYLIATVVVLGSVIGAQLSVVHVLTFLQALRTEFSWETFLLDPVTFIIWGWVAVALLFWGRVYCGWLCPFGALQEIINKAGQWLGVRQLAIPFALHERLWPIKYIAFLGLFAVSFASITMAFQGAEIEPFKTAVTLRFMREWPFVAYAVGLLVAGLFVERFFCRYLCPLGAAIAIPARLRMFEWLKRRPQCGRECRICATKCPVQAIHPEGHINPNECIYCLNCQTLYYDEHICPPLKLRAARRAAYAAKPEVPVT